MTGSTHRTALRRSSPLALAALAAGALTALTAGPASASTLPSVINASLASVSCPAANNCMAVGSFLGRIKGTSAFQTFTLAEQWNGTKWQIRTTPTPGSSGFLGGISCPAPAACMSVGSWTDPIGESSFTLAEAWNGTSWGILNSPDPLGATNSGLSGVSCTSPASCMAVGDFIGTGNGMTLAESWNGTRWSVVKTPRP